MRRIKALWIMFLLALGRGYIRIFGAPSHIKTEFEQLELEVRQKVKL